MGVAILAAGLAGCGERGGNGPVAAETAEASAAAEAPVANRVAAEAKLREEVAVVETAGLLPPNASLVSREPVTGAIAFDFRAAAPPERLAGWYRASTTGAGYEVTSEMQEGAEHVLSGTTRAPAGDFSVRLAPDGRGGTTAMVLVTLRR